MGLLSSELFVCVDCETTGLDPDMDAIIEVGAVRFTLAEPLATLSQLINPERPIPESSTAIHKIVDSMVEKAPTIATYLPTLLAFLEKGIIVGHGIQFDLTLIANAASRCGLECNLLKRRSIDTLRLARLYGESPNNSLVTLREHFGIPAEIAHRALEDAQVNMQVFKRLSERFKTTEELFEALSKPIKLKVMPLGKYKGRPFSELPLDFLRWSVRQDFDQDLLFSIKTELQKRQTGAQFRQSVNPFQDLDLS